MSRWAAPLLQFLALLAACDGDDEVRHEPTVEPPVADTGTPPPWRPTGARAAADAAAVLLYGEPTSAFFGGRMDFGDLTGDGVLDIAVYAADRGQPATYLFAGPLQGELGSSDAFAMVPWGNYGMGIGDLNGDGFEDVAALMGPYQVPYEFQLYFGPLSPLAPPTRPDAVVRPSGTAGSGELAYVCDANLDGVDDLVFTYGHGSTRFALGPVTERMQEGEAIDVQFEGDQGTSFPVQATAPFLCGHDLNGNGAADLLLGTFAQGNLLLVADPVWEGVQLVEDAAEVMDLTAGEYSPLEVVGDLDGDGYQDLLEGNLIVQGPIAVDSEAYATLDFSTRVTSTTPVGDLDGDGHDDLVVGMDDHSSNDGAVFLLYGPVAPGIHDEDAYDMVFTPPNEDANLGTWLVSDPRTSLWGASAPTASREPGEGGHVYLFDGLPGL